ncbi:MAG: hypothetical protein V4687_04665 [Bacteroidota bacterium]
MNNTFDINRFGLLLRRQWLEFGRIYLILLAVAFGVIATFYTTILWQALAHGGHFDSRLNFREPLFLIFGFLFISVIASNYYAHFGQKSRTVVELLIPASTFEKFIAGVFFTAFLTVASFILIFYLTDLGFVAKLKDTFGVTELTSSYTNADGMKVAVTDRMDYFFTVNSKNLVPPLFAIPAFVTSIFLLGSIYFNRFHYIKTAVSVMLFTGIWTYLVMNIVDYLTQNRHAKEDSGFIHNGPGEDTGLWLLFLLLFVLTTIIWAITYVRLKEKEV